VSADRLTDEQVALYAATVPTSIMDEAVLRMVSNAALVSLAIEVQARRKLVADLLALEPTDDDEGVLVTPGSLKHQGYMLALQRVRRLIEANRG